MSDTRRRHQGKKRYAESRPERVEQDKTGRTLKTRKQRRAADKRTWKKELTP